METTPKIDSSILNLIKIYQAALEIIKTECLLPYISWVICISVTPFLKLNVLKVLGTLNTYKQALCYSKTRQSMFVKHVPPLRAYFIEATKL